MTDDLTGVLDRRTWESSALAVLAHARRRRRPLALVLADLDRFKNINDTYGHPAGDEVLRATGAALRRADGAVVGRYGGHTGDEFLVLLPDTGLEDALNLAGALARGVGSLAVRARASRTATVILTGVTISMGVASCVPTGASRQILADLLLDADVALREAKRRGGDRVCAPGPDPVPGLHPVPTAVPDTVGTAAGAGEVRVPLAAYGRDTRHSPTELVLSQAAAEHVHAMLAQLLGRTPATADSLR